MAYELNKKKQKLLKTNIFLFSLEHWYKSAKVKMQKSYAINICFIKTHM
jgi:hypothetical protein